LWIHVAPDATLTVQVIDHEGAPAAGVDVGWSRRFPGDALPRFGRAGATDAAGRLVLHHTQLQAETWARLDPVGTGSSSIVPYIVGAPHPGVVVDPRDPPAETVVLRLPATGRLVVELVDADGDVVPRAFGARLTELDRDGRPFARWSRFPVFLVEGDAGRIVVPHVGVGTRLQVDPTSTGIASVAGDGPTQPGATATLRVRLDPEVPRICGRITGPFALSERSQVHLAIGLGGARGFWITGLEDDGTFDLALDRARAGQVVERVAVALAEAGPVTAAMAVCEPRVPLPAGPLELGELALEEAPLVASGTVVDATGQPVERVSLSVRPAVPVKGYPTELVHVGREPEGRFTIRGRPASDDLLLVRGL